MWARKVIFMDEPTAALGVVQQRMVLDLIRRVRDQGITVVLISHNMQQVLDVCDRVEVLRLGTRVAQLSTKGATVEDLVSAMTAGTIKEHQQ
jgi:simple sugar transport system ATP-binding protein